jgi:hypothetical protein
MDIGGALGGVVGGVLGLIGQNQTNQKNWDIAQSNNEWSAQQYATRYQTTVKDLQASGLNPMLAYGQGPGTAPTASAVAPMQNALGAGVEGFNKTRATSAAAALQTEQLKQVDSLTQLNSAQAAKATEEAKVAMEQAENLKVDRQKRTAEIPLTQQQTQTSVEQAKAYQGQATASAASAAQSYKTVENLNAQIDKLREEAKLIKQTGDKSLPESDFARKYPTTYLIIDKLLPSISGVIRSIPK